MRIMILNHAATMDIDESTLSEYVSTQEMQILSEFCQKEGRRQLIELTGRYCFGSAREVLEFVKSHY